jgi:hypothetical protein
MVVHSGFSQDKPIFPLFIAPDLDTNYIDLQRDKWSLRAFSTLKYHALRVRDKSLGETARFLPNNVFSVGVGFAYRFWLIDLGVAINPNREDGTEAFDLQTSVLLGSRHLISFGFQRYKGFNVNGLKEDIFRKDIRVIYGGIDYSYYFNYRKLSMRAVFRGDLRQLKSSFSPILGAFMSADYVKADSSLIPDSRFLTEAQIVDGNVWIAGVHGGAAGNWVVGRNLILYGSVTSGIGLEWGNIQAEGTRIRPLGGPAWKFNFYAAIVYTHPRFYLGISGNSRLYLPTISRDIHYQYGLGKIKLLFGWRFFSRVGFLEKANRLLEKR